VASVKPCWNRKLNGPLCVAQPGIVPAGCSKSLSSKAAGESKPEAYPLGYVEDFDEPRTKLADFFSILLDTDKLIRLLLHPDFGLRSMPRHHNRGILQGVQPLSNGLLDGVEVSAPEIGAPDAAAKECVAG